MIEKYTFDLNLPKIHKKLIVVKKDNELRDHVVMKLLAYCLFYHPGLQIEIPVNMHYKPDLAVLDERGVPELWIDCGHVAVVKVESLVRKLRRARLVLVKATKGEMEQFRALMDKKIENIERLEFVAFERGFVDSLSLSLERKNDLTFYWVKEDVLGIAMNDQIFESNVYH